MDDISTKELLEDLEETITDYNLSVFAKSCGIDGYGGEFSVDERIKGNSRVGLVILDELDSRKVNYADTISEIDNLRMQWTTALKES